MTRALTEAQLLHLGLTADSKGGVLMLAPTQNWNCRIMGLLGLLKRKCPVTQLRNQQLKSLAQQERCCYPRRLWPYLALEEGLGAF